MSNSADPDGVLFVGRARQRAADAAEDAAGVLRDTGSAEEARELLKEAIGHLDRAENRANT